ncbi:small ubiquitin-related modifier 1-like [Henckelia pumila]|uniref:small ubiquitin-related modifier 1-like n=1 Tax=Henckelia pumila TaxID=405737 RepID=UPI003C6E8647
MGPNAKGKGKLKQPMEMRDDRRIKLCFKSQDGTETFFKVSVDTKLQNLLIYYCKENALDQKSLRFLYNGKRLAAEMTPAQIGMEDEDEIDVMVHQIGGGRSE